MALLGPSGGPLINEVGGYSASAEQPRLLPAQENLFTVAYSEEKFKDYLIAEALKQPVNTKPLRLSDPCEQFRDLLIEFMGEALLSVGVTVEFERMAGVPHLVITFTSRTKPVHNEGHCILIKQNAADIIHQHSFAVVIEEDRQEKTVTATFYGHPAFKGNGLFSSKDSEAVRNLQEPAELIKLSPGFHVRNAVMGFISSISLQFRTFPPQIGEIQARCGARIDGDLKAKCRPRGNTPDMRGLGAPGP